MRLKKTKFFSILLVCFFIIVNPQLISGNESSEEEKTEESNYELFLIEVENTQSYAKIEPFVEVIIGISSNIEIITLSFFFQFLIL